VALNAVGVPVERALAEGPSWQHLAGSERADPGGVVVVTDGAGKEASRF
jgi:hypothetical protein